MAHTRKVLSTGRFGARYGSRTRKRFREVEMKTRAPQRCPRCATKRMKKVSVGIWQCPKCDAKVTGGAWELVTAQGRVAKRTTASKRREADAKKK